MHTSHFSVAGLVFLAIIAVVQFSPTQLAMAQCGGVTYTGVAGPSQIGTGFAGQPEYQNLGGGTWDPVIQDVLNNSLDYGDEPEKNFYSFMFPENVFAQCGGSSASSTPSVTLPATPGAISTPGSSTLSWAASNVASCAGGGFSTGGATSGEVVVSPTDTTVYTITCSVSGGSATWQYSSSNTNDYACPVTTRQNELFGNMPDCPNASPEGQACSPEGERCKVNTVSGCNVDSTIYTCSAGESVNDDVTVTVAACVPTYNASLWYTGGTQVGSASDGNNNPLSCDSISPGGITYTNWNREVRYQNSPVVDPVVTTCYYYTGSTGTQSKPPVTQGNDDYYYDSGTSCAVPPVSECSDGTDNDGDGDTDYLNDNGCSDGADDDESNDPPPQCSDNADNNAAGGSDYPDDPSCSSPDDDTEDGVVAGVSCTVDSTSVNAGGTTTYHASGTNGAGAPYTWTPSGQTNCTGGTNNTCTFTNPGPYTMSVRGTGGGNPSASCPVVTVGCVGAPEVSLTANGEVEDTRVNAGESATIAWEANGISASSCTLYENEVAIQTLTPNACNVTGSVARTINTQKVYTLDCAGDTSTVIVNIDAGPQEF